MRHLIPKEHLPHLKKRAVLEFIGLLFLFAFSITQWEIIDQALFAISKSNIYYLMAGFVLYWTLVPLTAASYILLSEKKISLKTTTLAQLAGSGPGRIIPGGLGHLSVSVMHLRKIGINTQKAVIISVANNLIGLSLNVVLLLILVGFQPNLRELIANNLTADSLIFATITIIMLVSLTQWLMHIRKTRESIIKVNKKWKHLFAHLRKNPRNIFSLYGLALLIIVGNVSILVLSAHALGFQINFIDALVALSAGVFIGGILPTPGGLGGVEAGTASSLILLGYASPTATSIALLYRTITYWQPLIPGTFAYLYLRERKLL